MVEWARRVPLPWVRQWNEAARKRPAIDHMVEPYCRARMKAFGANMLGALIFCAPLLIAGVVYVLAYLGERFVRFWDYRVPELIGARAYFRRFVHPRDDRAHELNREIRQAYRDAA